MEGLGFCPVNILVNAHFVVFLCVCSKLLWILHESDSMNSTCIFISIDKLNLTSFLSGEKSDGMLLSSA